LYKTIRKITAYALVTMMFLIPLTGCAGAENSAANNSEKDTLYQVSTLNALMLGNYDGVISCSELLSHGDTGVGTFDGLNGEMIVLDGKVYQAKEDGSVAIVNGEVTTPFAEVAFFDGDFVLEDLTQIEDMDALKTLLTDSILDETDNPNMFFMAKIPGNFKQILVRSEAAQSKPYAPLAEVLKEQTEYVYEDLSGTIVALYCPDYINGLGLAGWHFHFISEDYSKGGHVLDVSLSSGEAQIDLISGFHMLLPQDEAFAELELAQDMSEKTNAVEGK